MLSTLSNCCSWVAVMFCYWLKMGCVCSVDSQSLDNWHMKCIKRCDQSILIQLYNIDSRKNARLITCDVQIGVDRAIMTGLDRRKNC